MALSPNQNEGMFTSCTVLVLYVVSASSGGAKLVPDISTNHLWDFSDSPPWLMFQQCSFGIERSPCRLPSDSLWNSLCKHVLPNSLRHALISLTGKETRGSKNCKEQSLNCWGFFFMSSGQDVMTAWCQGDVKATSVEKKTSNSRRCLSELHVKMHPLHGVNRV